jgi:ABC-2 type transport system ATP-binding protein
MRQRVKLAQALVHDPQLVMLDEPTNGLDPAGRDEMLGLIRRIGTVFGISVLVTSHLMGELERVCDHVVVIDGGRLMRSSSTADVTAVTELLSVEVDGEGARVAARLRDLGVDVRAVPSDSAGNLLELDLRGDETYDLVRDVVAELEVGLVRLERRRHHMLDMFRATAGAGAAAGEEPPR